MIPRSLLFTSLVFVSLAASAARVSAQELVTTLPASVSVPVALVPEPKLAQESDGSYLELNTGIRGFAKNFVLEQFALRYNANASILIALYGEPVVAIPVAVPPIQTSVTSGTSTSSVADLLPVATTTVPGVMLPQSALLNALHEARTELMRQVRANAAKEKETVYTSDKGWRTLTLAVWNKASNEIKYVNVDKKGMQLKNISDPIFKRLVVTRDNGVNSGFRVEGNEDWMVIALRFPVYEPLNTKKTKFRPESVVYSPYSSGVHTPEVVEAGRAYLDDLVEGVYARLRADGIRSRAFPDRLLVDVIDPGMVKSIAAIEHLDQSLLTKDANRALETFFVILGTNEDQSYNLSRSSANALGLVQFIPSTYNRLAARSEWGLNTNFEVGMTDHKNAIRAQVVYLDVLLTELPREARDLFMQTPRGANEYIVASYNGGSARVRKAMTNWDKMFDGTAKKELAALQSKVNAMKPEIETLRLRTLRQKDAKARAKLQSQLNAKRAELKTVQASIDRLSAGLLRNETIQYIVKYRLTNQNPSFLHRETVLTAVSAEK